MMDLLYVGVADVLSQRDRGAHVGETDLNLPNVVS